MGSLPESVALQTRWGGSNRKYLSCKKEDGSLNFDGEMVVSLTTRFATERSSENGQLVHIRCTYNNKYVVRSNQVSWSLHAKAEEIEEDASRWSCTLFKPEFDQPQNAFRLRHIHSGMFVGISSNRFQLLSSSPNPPLDLMDVVDWRDLVVLPDAIVLKGNNGKYLAALALPGPGRFVPGIEASSSDIGDEKIRHEIVYRSDGSINMESLSTQFVRPRNAWVTLIEGIQPIIIGKIPDDSPHYFVPIKVGSNSIALRIGHFQSRQHCRLVEIHEHRVLYNDARTLVRETIFEVEEPVLSREVFNIRLRFEDARIYGQTPIVVSTVPSTNTTQEEHHREFNFFWEETRERSWRAFISLELGLSMTFHARIPFIGKFGFEVSPEARFEYEWGRTDGQKEGFSDTYSFPVPPMTRVTAYLSATRGTCDIPFDYTVSDLLTDGRRITHDVEGGVFTGVNNYNFDAYTTSDPV